MSGPIEADVQVAPVGPDPALPIDKAPALNSGRPQGWRTFGSGPVRSPRRSW